MTVVVVYDICTKDAAGRKRLKRVCRTCRNYGIAVQDSVYECEVDAAQYRALQKELASRIAPETDSVCFYLLGNHPTPAWSDWAKSGFCGTGKRMSFNLHRRNPFRLLFQTISKNRTDTPLRHIGPVLSP